MTAPSWVVIRRVGGRVEYLGQHAWLPELKPECAVESEDKAHRYCREPGEEVITWEEAVALPYAKLRSALGGLPAVFSNPPPFGGWRDK